MSLPKYPEYKESGIDWAASLPAHWSMASLKWLCQRYSGGTPDKNRPEYWENGTIPWLNSAAVNDGRIYEASAFITQEAFENSSAKWIPPDALVMALAGQGKTKGMVAHLMIEATCNQSMAALVPTNRVAVRYLYWWLASNYQNIRNMAGGDLRDGLNLDLLGAIPCPLPHLAEQTAIAAFLDRETAKIDALIAEQEKLIALLAEKRQATISHAVTRGLNPDAPMKDSGVAWLGEVPAHWAIRRLKTVTAFTTSGPRGWSERISEEGSLFIQSGDLNQSLEVDFDGAKRVTVEDDAEAARTRLVDGDVVVCITGAKTGNVAVCTCVPEPAYVNQHLCLVRPNAEVLPLFIGAVLKSAVGQTQFELSQYGLKQGLSLENVKDVLIPLPPRSEQECIISYIHAEASRLALLKAEAERAIVLLKERRSALITAAVTGQIDVRDAVPQELAA